MDVGQDLCGTRTAPKGMEGWIPDFSDREVFPVVTGDGRVKAPVDILDMEWKVFGRQECPGFSSVLGAANVLGFDGRGRRHRGCA